MAGVSIHWFEIPVQDLARAAKFYSEILGVELGEMPGPDGPMTTFQNDDVPSGALVPGDHNSPSKSGPLVYLGTEDIDGVVGRIGAAGGEVILPKTSIGPHGNIAHFIDSEGNRVALHSG